MDKREPCGVEIQPSLRTSSASINTEVTQVDSSNPYDSDRPISYREIELEHLDGNSNSEHAKDLKACESCVTNPDLEQNPLHENPTVRNSGIEERDRSLMKAERAEIRSRRRMIILIVTLLCLAGAVQGILVNGLINVVISSLEKRFGIRSTESGFIASSYDIASFICLLPVSYLGGRGTGSKPAWIGGGILLMGLGSLLFSLPHFITEEYVSSGAAGSAVSFCRTEQTCASEQMSGDNKFKFIFMGAQLLHGAGAAPLYTLGVTYIDENVGTGNSAFYLGVFYTMAIVGPAIGYGIGGQLLNIHTDFASVQMEEWARESDWVGAWWLGFLICGIFSIILAFSIFMLPSSLPGVQDPPGDQVCTSRLPSRASSFRSSFKAKSVKPHDDFDLRAGGGALPVGKELITALCILFTNPTFVAISLAGASEGFLMQGLATFLPKLLQNTFSLSESQAAINVGVISVVAGGGGTLLGGMIVKKFALKVPGLLKLTSITQFFAILAAIGLLAGCSVEMKIHGTQPGDVEGCAQDCECELYNFNPLCLNGEQYYNPCWAGCTDINPATGGYVNCSCSVLTLPIEQTNTWEPVSLSEIEGVPGLCPSNCTYLPIFLTSFFFTMLITFLANMPSLTATLRCVDPSVRSLALGVQWLFIRLLGTIPGPVAMGRTFDSNCNHWREGCNGPENCLIYDNSNLSFFIMSLTACCKGLSIIAFLFGVRLYKSPSSELIYAQETEPETILPDPEKEKTEKKVVV